MQKFYISLKLESIIFKKSGSKSFEFFECSVRTIIIFAIKGINYQ